MCLGIEMRIQSIADGVARCESRGITRQVNLFLLQGLEPPVQVNDYVLVHVGYAIQRVDPELARENQALLEQARQNWPDRLTGDRSGDTPPDA